MFNGIILAIIVVLVPFFSIAAGGGAENALLTFSTASFLLNIYLVIQISKKEDKHQKETS
ncbi:hypothetical protein [Sutcliffiella halmapala]|uniref:hypothetical protein n=1 Tax=Sutcliffiella halmapala TaxID=79882 RepID=UPI0009949CB6|nr:hypothetical protein [Sutcliffiella halmapala]